jgi:acetate---CoA ligase (ADP-forming)
VHVPSLDSSPSETAAGIARGAAAVPVEKPVLTVFIAAAGAPDALDRGPRGRLPAYPFPENAALALSAAERYGRGRRRPRGVSLELDRTAASTIRAVIDRVRGQGDGHRWLEPRDLAMVLRAAGITYAESHLVAPAEAADFAETIGYPLVAKAVAPGLAGRTEHGCVVMGLTRRKDVADAVQLLRRRTQGLGLALESILLQREAAAGIEAVVEVRVDPLFGPVIVCGLGGVLVSLLGDQAVRLPPVTDVDAAEMIDGLRARALLEGYRGVGPGDRPGLEDLLRRVSALIDVVPELHALELDPIKILPPGYGVVVVDGRLAV